PAAVLDHAVLEAEGEMPREHAQGPARGGRVARGIGEHAAGRIAALKLQLGGPTRLDRPARGGEAHTIALGGIEDAVLHVGGAAAGEKSGEEHASPPRHRLFSTCREASSSKTRRSGRPRAARRTMVWNQRSATPETTRPPPHP